MKRLIVLTALGSFLTAPLAVADPPRGPPPGYRAHPVYGAPHYRHYYGYRYPTYYRHGHSHGSDDAAWAIGGLVLGAVIGTAAARAEQRSDAQQAGYTPASTPLPPPQKRKVVTCYDEVAYDKQGEPYVARQCYEDWR